MPKNIIEKAFEDRANLTPLTASPELKKAINEAIALLNTGKARVAEKIDGTWQTHQWLKKAVLLYFRLYDNHVIDSGFIRYFDKVPLKFNSFSEDEFKNKRRSRCATRNRSDRLLYRTEYCSHALLREYGRLRGFRHTD